jgi:5-methylcytosine-specific restriction endonuclease McrA
LHQKRVKRPEVKEQRRVQGRKPADEEYRQRAQERTRQWALDHPERAKHNARVSGHRRRAIEKLAPGSFTTDDIASILRMQGRKCAYCRRKLGLDYHIDHIIALSRPGGSNHRSNIQITCAKCNLAKGARDPIDYARALGRLL